MNEVKRICGDCNTTKTPLWRAGPRGPRSLCNACGIRYRKRKMAEDEDKQPSSEIRTEKSNSIKTDNFNDEIQTDESLKMGYGYRDLGNRIFVQRSSSSTFSSSSSSSSSKLKKQRSSSEESINSSNRDLGEVEQAAVLLMSLSCGSVFA
ncbi:GATA transcription factor 16 [Bienertia sinuspersici]